MIVLEEPYENYFVVPARTFAQRAQAILNKYSASDTDSNFKVTR